MAEAWTRAKYIKQDHDNIHKIEVDGYEAMFVLFDRNNHVVKTNRERIERILDVISSEELIEVLNKRYGVDRERWKKVTAYFYTFVEE